MPLNSQCQRHGQQQQWPASPGASSQCVWCGMASSAASGAPWPVRVVRYPVHPKQCETEAESVQRRATVASPSSAMQQAPSTPRRRARAATPSSARALKHQRKAMSGADLVCFCGFARHLLAGFLSKNELVRTARGCLALRYTLRGWLSWDGLSVWGWSLQEFVDLGCFRQCLSCLNRMCEITGPVSSGLG